MLSNFFVLKSGHLRDNVEKYDRVGEVIDDLYNRVHAHCVADN
jgi:hypothetical protein